MMATPRNFFACLVGIEMQFNWYVCLLIPNNHDARRRRLRDKYVYFAYIDVVATPHVYINYESGKHTAGLVKQNPLHIHT